MNRRTAICFAIAAASLAAVLPGPAGAQGQLPSYEVATIIRSMGLDPLGSPVRRGSAYVLRALDGYGQQLNVTVDARTGRVLSVQPVAAAVAPYPGRPPAYVPAPGYMAPGYMVPPYTAPAYPPQLYYPGDEFEPDLTYEPMPPNEPRVIYAPRQSSSVPRPPARVPTAKAPAAKPAPKAAAAAPVEATSPELTTGSINDTTKQAETSPALVIPPVQSLE